MFEIIIGLVLTYFIAAIFLGRTFAFLITAVFLFSGEPSKFDQLTNNMPEMNFEVPSVENKIERGSKLEPVVEAKPERLDGAE